MSQNGKSKAQVIRQYFGSRPNTTTADFMREYKALTDEDKHELAVGSAQALGIPESECNFAFAS